MQLDLFAAAGVRPVPSPTAQPPRVTPPPAALTDADLIAAIPDAGQATCHTLAEEAARRKLAAAIPALESLCRRFKGFGLEHPVPEQIASLRALASIGGRDAVAALRRIVTGDVVAGPGQLDAVRAAAALRCILPEPTAAALLRHPDPDTRAQACRCAPCTEPIATLLGTLLEDLNAGVATEAAKALGRMGRPEGRSWLLRLLRQTPDADLIDALPSVADEECTILLGRIARQDPALRVAALAALEAIDTPRAAAILAALGDPGAARSSG